MHAYVAGDAASFEKIYERYHRRLFGIGAVLLLSFLCPPPNLVATARSLGWFAQNRLGAELLVGLGFGILPIAVSLLVVRRAGASLKVMGGIGAVLLGAELPLLFAQCCSAPSVHVWPVLAGTLLGAALLTAVSLLSTRFLGGFQRNLYV